MKDRKLKKAWKHALLTIKREKLMTISNIVIMTISFLMLGAFISVFVFSQTAIKRLEDQAQITAFFKDDYPEAEILKLKTKLEADDRIYAVSYISKENAYKIFTDLNKNEPVLLESISVNILPASLEVKTSDIDHLADLAGELRATDGVEEVKYFEDVIGEFKRWSGLANVVGLIMVIIFLFVSFAVVMITLRMTIKSKGTELSILKLVGASDSYVVNPLILQGLFFGLVSSGIASLLLMLLTLIVLSKDFLINGKIVLLSFLPVLSIPPLLYLLLLTITLLLSGYALGYLGSLVAVKRYLKY